MQANRNSFLPRIALTAVMALAVLPPTPLLAAEDAPRNTARQPVVVNVVKAERRSAPQTVVTTGSLAARSEVLVSPQVEGLRIIELLAEEGDRVSEGQVLARLDRATLDTQFAQLQAGLNRAGAVIAQAKSKIAESEAMAKQAEAAFGRARDLVKSGTLSKAVYDEREAAARSTAAGLASARDGLTLAQADKAQTEAQIREMALKLSYSDIKAPSAGIVSRRTAKLGAVATAAAEPLFRIVGNGEIELDGAVADIFLPQIAPGMKVRIEGSGLTPRDGTVRLVSPEVNQATREGRLRISVHDGKDLRVGAFAMGTILVSSRETLMLPYSAVMHGDKGAIVLVVKDGRVETRKITVGVINDANAEITAGLSEGEDVVLRAGASLHEGDPVTPAVATDNRTKGD